jgi:hypothetical protein
MGIVYEAEHGSFKNRLALKVLGVRGVKPSLRSPRSMRSADGGDARESDEPPESVPGALQWDCVRFEE